MKDNSTERLMIALRSFALERHRYLNQLARSQHLTRAEFDTLDYIEEAGALRPSALAARLGLTTGAVTSVLDGLEKAGLVKRSPNPNDRRSVVVRLTKRAESAGVSAIGTYVGRIANEAKKLSPKDRELVTRFLDGVTKALVNGESRLP
jgi:DNA-binding MarR family transcriptional regulator